MGSRLEKNSSQVRKRIEAHTFDNEQGDEYEGSKFGGFNDYFRRKKIKLQNLDAQLRSTSGEKPPIFKGIVAHVNGYTQPSLNDIHHLIVSYGGGFMQYLDGKTTVTHIIAANLTPKKAIEFRRYRIVKPAWVVDSVAAGKCLPWERYRVLDEGAGQRLIGVDAGKVTSQANTQQRGYRGQSNTSWYTSQVRSVAEDIDDEDGAQFPSTQKVALNGSSTYLHSSVKQRIEDVGSPKLESFELTSSLEDALNTAARNAPTTSKVVLDQERFPMEAADETATITPITHTQPATFTQDDKDARAAESPITDLPVTPVKKSGDKSRSLEEVSVKTQTLTAEEHNALLLADPHIRKSTTANPEFLQQYYRESRLHHLSAWKADLKLQLQQIASEKSSSQKQLVKRRPGSRRYIMHVDFDSFFCAVSLKNAPEYVDKPAVVAHGIGSGSEIASCNYPARAFGVKNGMWMKHALPLCPDLKVLPYDFPAYEEASRGFYKAILDIGGVVQSVSVDEALIDVSSLVSGDAYDTDVLSEQKKADEIATTLRRKIKEITACAVSVGIGENILLAKVALRKAKPAGQHQIRPEDVLGFIGELKIQDLPGVAGSIGGKLAEINVNLVKDVRALTKDRLMTILGPKTGEKIWEYSKGIDKTEVGEQTIRKSVSAEVNWGIRFISQPEAEEFVQNLCCELQKRLLDAGVKGRQMTFKIMRRAADAPLDPPKNLGHGKCDTFNKSIVLGVATNSVDVIGKEAVSILRSYGFSPGELRGLGVQMTKLEPMKPRDLTDSSQKRINFGAAAKPSKRDEDPIDDFDSPVKARMDLDHPAMSITRINEADSSVKKPLNLMGTQFIMPTQIDPKVLEELPIDIRSRLMAQQKTKPASRYVSPVPEPPANPQRMEEHRLPSQLDPDVFDALPEDMKAEILASYPSRKHSSRGQSLLPQSPRKVRTIVLSKKPISPSKPKRARPLGSRIKANDSSSYMQSNFASRLLAVSDFDSGQESEGELDTEFLSALPEEVRNEVIAEHKRKRLIRKGGLVTATKRRKNDLAAGQRTLRLTPRPPKPTFTTMKLSSLEDLREMVESWHDEFKDEGPLNEDVHALERYLRRVIGEEKNMSKVVNLLRWLDWIVSESTGLNVGVRAWERAVEGIKEQVQQAVAERGLGILRM